MNTVQAADTMSARNIQSIVDNIGITTGEQAHEFVVSAMKLMTNADLLTFRHAVSTLWNWHLYEVRASMDHYRPHSWNPHAPIGHGWQPANRWQFVLKAYARWEHMQRSRHTSDGGQGAKPLLQMYVRAKQELRELYHGVD